MSEIRQRHLETQGSENVLTEKNTVEDQKTLEKTFQSDDTSAAARKNDDEKESEDTVPMETDDIQDDVMAQAVPQDSKKKEQNILEQSLSWLPTRWKNWVIRGIFTWVMIFGFAGVVYMGPLALMCLVLVIQIACFHEIISIGYSVYKVYDLPWFRSLSWYFLITSNYFFYGESMVDSFGMVTQRDDFLQFLVTHHRLISFFLYITGLMWFVLSLVKTHYLRQFSLFAWTHVTLVILVSQSHLFIQNIFNGLVWFLMPVSMIICNDIMAYMFGFFFGKTPLIKLSPKKTWEGFIGGMFSTVIFGWFLAILLVKWDYFVCPVDFSDGHLNMTCERISTFKLQEYFFPGPIQALCAVLKVPRSIHLYPFQLHTISMSLFASVIGPFGGFFASGFKRAFKVKDFGDLIPGHGGVMDRFDCQLLMATFVHTYHFTFIRAANPQKLLQAVMALKPEDQLEFFRLLKEKLTNTGVLPLEA